MVATSTLCTCATPLPYSVGVRKRKSAPSGRVDNGVRFPSCTLAGIDGHFGSRYLFTVQRLLLTVTAMGMVASTALIPIGSFDDGRGHAVTPASAFFAIWGLVIVLCLIVAALSWRRSATPAYRVAGWPLVIAQLGFSVWLLVAWAQSAWGTVVVFAGILAALVVGLYRLRTQSDVRQNGLVATTLGLYAGWSTAAIWLNLVTNLPARYADAAWMQSLCLVGAGVSALAVIVWIRPGVAYVLAVEWALVGVAIAAASYAAWAPFTITVISAVAAAAMFLQVRRSGA